MKRKIICLCFCLLLILPVFLVMASDNQPPNPPTITGPRFGKVGERHEYTFTAIDPDGDDVQYIIFWGDGTFIITKDFYPSGEKLTVGIIYPEKGQYVISAKAQDVFGAAGDWGTFEMIIPKNKAINTPFLQFFENYLYKFSLLRQILLLQ